MAKLVVALAILSVGLANGLANFGGSACEVEDYKERFESLEAQVAEIKSLVESIAAKPCCEATAQPTVTPPELNGCGQPCGTVIPIDDLAFDPLGIEADTCYEIVGDLFSAYDLELSVEVSCAKITVPSGSGLLGLNAQLPRPAFCPAPHETHETLRRGARRSTATIRRSSSKAI